MSEFDNNKGKSELSELTFEGIPTFVLDQIKSTQRALDEGVVSRDGKFSFRNPGGVVVVIHSDRGKVTKAEHRYEPEKGHF